MTEPADDAEARTASGNGAGSVFEQVVRVAVGLALLVWCGNIIAPFVHALIWGVLLAVVLLPPFRRAVRANRGRVRTTAILFAAVGVTGVLLPTILLSTSLVEGAQHFSERLLAGKVGLPPPPDSVAEWPVIGGPLFATWSKGATNISALAEPLAPHLKPAAGWLLAFAGSFAGAIIQALLAIVIACAFLAHFEWADRTSRQLAHRLIGRRGTDFAHIATVTVRGVARGVLGVALIQSTAAGLGFAVVGVPAAGLWALVCLLLCVVQIPVALVLVPTVFYVFSVEPTTTAVLYAVWAGVVSVSDNFLKPFLFGDQVQTPVLVLLIGSIGGMLASGVIGLFTGAVVLALGFELVYAWLNGERGTPSDATEDPASGDDVATASAATG